MLLFSVRDLVRLQDHSKQVFSEISPPLTSQYRGLSEEQTANVVSCDLFLPGRKNAVSLIRGIFWN